MGEAAPNDTVVQAPSSHQLAIKRGTTHVTPQKPMTAMTDDEIRAMAGRQFAASSDVAAGPA
jgi:hypothetical protein